MYVIQPFGAKPPCSLLLRKMSGSGCKIMSAQDSFTVIGHSLGRVIWGVQMKLKRA